MQLLLHRELHRRHRLPSLQRMRQPAARGGSVGSVVGAMRHCARSSVDEAVMGNTSTCDFKIHCLHPGV